MAQLHDYELEGLIGRGSMGLVYRARPRAGGQVVALKRLRWVGGKHLVDRLRWEASGIASLDHPHILKVAELIADEEGLAIAMHLADGGSLGDALGRRGRLPAEEGALLGANVADALSAIHALGIVHADVKPSNILLDGVGERGGVPLLSDVGLSRWTAAASPWGGALGGTAEYLDPTVAAGASPSAASDLYSLGVVCYQILAGRLPYRGVTPLATLRASDRGDAEPLVDAVPSVPIGLAAIVERAMSRRPQARPSNAGEVADVLRAVVTVGDRPAEDRSRTTEPRRIRARRGSSHRSPEMPAPSRRSRAPAMTASVATALVVVAATWAFGHRSGTHHSTDPCRARKSAAPQRTAPTPGVVTVLADVAGDGCPVPVMWSSGDVTVSPTSGQAPVRFALGEPADELLLGEWDCRRGARPALYRPATGQVFYFDAWAEPGRDLTPSLDDSTAITDGLPRVVRDGARGCDRVEVARTRGPPP